MLRFKTLFLLLFSASILSAQVGYFATDSSIKHNIEIVDHGDKTNSQKVVINDHGKLLEFSPDDITEYGYPDGRVFFSKKIESGMLVFMERLVKGNTNLYYHKGRGARYFYLQKDSTSLIELRKRDENGKVTYKKELLDFTSDFPDNKENIKLVSYNKNSMSNFILRYNQSSGKPMPFFKFGICVGYEWMKLIPSGFIYEDPLTAFEYKYEGGLTFGIFIDNPVKVSDLSFHMELTYSSHDFAYQANTAGKELYYTATLSSIRMPVQIKYTHPSETRIRPYASAGLVYLNNFMFEDELISTDRYTSISYYEYIYRNNFGFSASCGFDLKLTTRNYLFFELRYNRFIGKIHFGSGKQSNSDLSLFSGINF